MSCGMPDQVESPSQTVLIRYQVADIGIKRTQKLQPQK